MAETAAHLVEHALPEQPIRQWVLSFPFPLRFLFATRPAVLTGVLGIVYRAVSIEHCGVCGGTLRVIACIETPKLIEKILTHLAARETGGINPPRAPPLHPPQAQPPASPLPTLS